MEINLFGKSNSVLKIQFQTRSVFYFCKKLNYHKMKSPIHKFLYIGFLFLGIYQALFTKDYMQAAASLGIGMAFDPFNQEQKWSDRPTWKKTILFIHLGFVATLFIIGFASGSK